MDSALVFEIEEISRYKIINETIAKGDSDVQLFYENKVVFVTGGSGFIGKQLIEKLLRSCNLKNLYMLIRPKKQMAIHSRLKEIFEDPLYDVLRKVKPDFMEKVIPVEGDVEQLNLGISEDDRKMLIEQINIIIHVAATTNFNELLKKATLTNVRGTREVLNLGIDCKYLKALIHVSTAFTPSTYDTNGQDIFEKFYPTPVSPEALIKLAETLDETKIDGITPALIRNWPNSYAFTKRVAEELVREREGHIPIAIVRPAVVTGTYREPTPGWIDKSALFSAIGFVAGAGLGVLHVLLSKPNNTVSYVPVDMVNNATIIAAHKTAERWDRNEKDIKIYAVVNARNTITIGQEIEILECNGRYFPTEKNVYYPFLVNAPNKYIYYILTWILHFIPGFVADALLSLFGKKPILSKVYNKIYRLNDVLAYFMMHGWTFHDENLIEMYQSLSPADQIIYNCDLKDVVWDRYITIWCIGIRKYIYKDGLKHTNYAKKKHNLLRIIHYIVTPLYIYSLWKVFTLSLFLISVAFHWFFEFCTKKLCYFE